MRLTALAAILIYLVSPALVAPAAAQQVNGMTSLDSLRDRARPLLIFAAKQDDPQLEIQIRTLTEHAAEATERDLVPIALPYNNPSPTAAQLSPTDAEAARRQFHVAPGDFTVILLGKDGGAKLRSNKPFSMEKLNQVIDSMPMRQDEIKSKHGR